MAQGVPPNNIMRVQLDEVSTLEGASTRYCASRRGLKANIVTEPFNNRAHQGQSTHLFVDEVQNIRGWRGRFESPVDSTSTKVLLTGKAAALSLSEISQFRGLNCYTPFLPNNGLTNLLRKEFRQYLVRPGVDNAGARAEAFTYFSECGAYPIAHNQADSDWPLLADQLNKTVIQSVLQRDIAAALGADTRDAALMKRLFRLARRHAGQSVSYERIA